MPQGSIFQSQFELHHARQIDLRTDAPKIGGVDVCADTTKSNRVQQVESVSPKRQPQVLAELEIPGQTEILIGEVWIA
jgi:hypothetical protein